jgi:hypothetical protein
MAGHRSCRGATGTDTGRHRCRGFCRRRLVLYRRRWLHRQARMGARRLHARLPEKSGDRLCAAGAAWLDGQLQPSPMAAVATAARLPGSGDGAIHPALSPTSRTSQAFTVHGISRNLVAPTPTCIFWTTSRRLNPEAGVGPPVTRPPAFRCSRCFSFFATDARNSHDASSSGC